MVSTSTSELIHQQKLLHFSAYTSFQSLEYFYVTMWQMRIFSRYSRKAVCQIVRGRGYVTTNQGRTAHVCIVGSGPAGFYTAEKLLRLRKEMLVDIYEKLPVPFGLVRYGVAPDHPEVKNVINTFTKVAKNERCHFMGNVTVGRDISVDELRQAYTAVVLAYGADEDRTFGIPGEDLSNVIPARNFVGWYNGLPEDKNLAVDLNVDTAVVLGQGNVALDVARILLSPIDTLAKTDISQHALEAVMRSAIKRVVLVGRRGPLQVAFTIKELREMIKLPACRPVMPVHEYQHIEKALEDAERVRKRIGMLLYKTAIQPEASLVDKWASAARQWELRYCRSPMEILGHHGMVAGMRFGVNRLEGETVPTQKAVPTGETEEIACGLVVRSIGYRSRPIDQSIPFNAEQGVVKNTGGRVTDSPGVYCCGWVGRGPVGVILSTVIDGRHVGTLIVDDMHNGILKPSEGREYALQLLNDRGVRTVSLADWEKIDAVETARGQKIGKPREKITDIDEMLKIASE